MGARPHGQGRVCGQHREHNFYPPANFLQDWSYRRRNLWHCLDGAPPEGEVLLPSMWYVISHISAPRVAHPFDVERGAGLAGWLYRQRREPDAHEACLVNDEPHHSHMPEKAPPPLNVSVVILHGIHTLLGSLTTASSAPDSVTQATPSSARAAADATAPTAPYRRLCLS